MVRLLSLWIVLLVASVGTAASPVFIDVRLVSLSPEGYRLLNPPSSNGIGLFDDVQLRALLTQVQRDQTSNVLQLPRMTVQEGKKSVVELKPGSARLVEDGKNPGLTLALKATVARKAGSVAVALSIGQTYPDGTAARLHKTLVIPHGRTALVSAWEISNGITSRPARLPATSRQLLALVSARVEEPSSASVASSEECEPKPAIKPLYSNSRTFDLVYKLANVGPAGVRGIDIWSTRDTRDWSRQARDVQAGSSIKATVAADGRYGFTLVPKNAAGLGGTAPTKGDQPQLWIEVDTVAPAITLSGTKVIKEQQGTMISLDWSATDAHLTTRPVSVQWSQSSDGPWTDLATNLAAKGRISLPVKDLPLTGCYFRLQASDEAGNVGTTVSEKVILDVQIPRCEVLGIQPR